jgi:ribosomal protein S6E (S10)
MTPQDVLNLVARALRARRTVTWSDDTGFPLSNRFHGLTRSQILKDLRQSYRLQAAGFELLRKEGQILPTKQAAVIALCNEQKEQDNDN